MAKKGGHYCRGCGRYRANEKFSGKGHKLHICKDCKGKGRTGVEEEQFFHVKQRHNSYRKPLKIKLVMKNDTEEYIIFLHMGKRYMVIVSTLSEWMGQSVQ